jgi:hypothetical protein
MPLYHVKVFVPNGLKLPRGTKRLVYSNHAKDQFMYRRVSKLPESIELHKCKAVEIETNEKNEVVKVLYRTSQNEKKDLILVVIPIENDKMLVKTLWENHKTDTHRTLDTSRYAKK